MTPSPPPVTQEERDELILAIDFDHYDRADEIADAILALGYRKPTPLPDDLEELERLARAVIALAPQAHKHDGIVTCPLCDGDGDVDAVTVADSTAIFVAGLQAFGVGASLEILEAYVDACTPQSILSLLSWIRGATEGRTEAVESPVATGEDRK